MSDIAQVSAPAEIAAPAPVSEAPATTADIQPLGDRPISTEGTSNEPIKVEVVTPKPKTSMDSLKEAQAKLAANETKEVKIDPKLAPVKADTPKLDDKGKPIVDVAKVESVDKPKYEPPARWTQTAKEKWAALDDEVKAETIRTVKELETGLEKHKEKAVKWDDLKEFEDMATQYKTNLKDALKNYTSLDKALQSSDPAAKIQAFEEIFKIAKVSPQDYAAYITGQPADQKASQSDAVIRELRQQVQTLSQQVQGVTTNIEGQQRSQTENYLAQWAADKPHAEALTPQIAGYVKQGLSLDDAYAKSVSDQQAIARSMGFIPQETAPVVAPAAQTLKGPKSITGAPSAGSYQATQKPSNSNSEALLKAMNILGIN
jgi:hypothetical protein